jgi:hypothetical protein
MKEGETVWEERGKWRVKIGARQFKRLPISSSDGRYFRPCME